MQLPEPASWNQQHPAQLPPLLTETPQFHCCPWHRRLSPGRGDLPNLAGLETWHEPVPTLKEQPPLPPSEHARAAVLCLRPKPLFEDLLACTHILPCAAKPGTVILANTMLASAQHSSLGKHRGTTHIPTAAHSHAGCRAKA